LVVDKVQIVGTDPKGLQRFYYRILNSAERYMQALCANVQLIVYYSSLQGRKVRHSLHNPSQNDIKNAMEVSLAMKDAA